MGFHLRSIFSLLWTGPLFDKSSISAAFLKNFCNEPPHREKHKNCTRYNVPSKPSHAAKLLDPVTVLGTPNTNNYIPSRCEWMNRDFRIFDILGITHLTQFEIGNIAEDAHLHHGNAAKPLVKLTHTLYRSFPGKSERTFNYFLNRLSLLCFLFFLLFSNTF